LLNASLFPARHLPAKSTAKTAGLDSLRARACLTRPDVLAHLSAANQRVSWYVCPDASDSVPQVLAMDRAATAAAPPHFVGWMSEATSTERCGGQRIAGPHGIRRIRVVLVSSARKSEVGRRPRLASMILGVDALRPAEQVLASNCLGRWTCSTPVTVQPARHIRAGGFPAGMIVGNRYDLVSDGTRKIDFSQCCRKISAGHAVRPDER
jgi:hypothetical protein